MISTPTHHGSQSRGTRLNPADIKTPRQSLSVSYACYLRASLAKNLLFIFDRDKPATLNYERVDITAEMS